MTVAAAFTKGRIKHYWFNYRLDRLRAGDRDGPFAATLVAIAKNEAPYIVEWIAHNLAVGFHHVVVYDNNSDDGTLTLLQQLASRYDCIDCRSWVPEDLHASPQTTAYENAIENVSTKWVMFLDIDEFLVPFRDGTVSGFLRHVPNEAASVHINWRGFGSNGLEEPTGRPVTSTFTRCSHAAWGNNLHFKTIAQTKLIEKVQIHNVLASCGSRLLSDMSEFTTIHGGMSDRIVHDGIQINHYQCKSFSEFQAKMEKGDANYHVDHIHRARVASRAYFDELDRNEVEDDTISMFRQRLERITKQLQASLRSGT